MGALKVAILGLGWWAGTLLDAVRDSALIRFVAAATRSRSPRDQELAASHGLRLAGSLDELLADAEIQGIVLATPPSGHRTEIIQCARAGRHVFCEKPLASSRADALQAIDAVERAGVTLGLGYNRRFHPSWVDLRRRIRSGELGIILHAECTMSGPNALTMSPGAWRGSPAEAPCGGLMPMGVHAIDGFIDLLGEIEGVWCQSLHRAAPGPNDDTTSMLFRLRSGATAYLGTMTATAASYRFQVYGSAAMAMLGGAVHVAGQSSAQRRTGLFGSYLLQPVGAEPQWLDVPAFDVNRAELEAFAGAALGGTPYPIALAQMIHGAAVTEAVLASAGSGQYQSVA